ncbi:c-type cytochrome [Loktanella sp. SALINAS62]|uniref:c-type cytochrome n=1 Tax=Loktanella sp. SALINAS62 TaxID=2706124 RepID=UPI001B8B735F|nr:c-type cytochrome [Loktanella sp. SALINAS62]MBS1300958.1 c-type cytochrome [Loktanella sp. SALINAS62]
MKRVIQTLAAMAAVGIITGAAIVFGGLYNVSARAGHFPGVTWLLHTAYVNSVQFRAPAMADVPDLDADGMVALGARHFDGGCRVCHAAPGQDRWAVPTAMVPKPPHIQTAVAGWNVNELYWIVDEGVKMSGMPHWPADRTDDVWPVVAFLAQVPDMTQAEYDALTARPRISDDAPDDLAYCAMCHGVTGFSTNPQIPRLDIQPRRYLEQALQSYVNQTRDSGIMHVAASRVSPAALMELAEWYSRQPVVPSAMSSPADAELMAYGARLASAGTRDVPACTSCHGPKAGPQSADFPRLAGQSRIYLEQQLTLWRDGERGGGPRAELMQKAAHQLTEDKIKALSAWFSAQPAMNPEPNSSEDG